MEPYTLEVKTCNFTNAGSVDQLRLSFCDGESDGEDGSCSMGPANVYNTDAELKEVGAWNTLLVPLEYEPSTMAVTIDGDDAW